MNPGSWAEKVIVADSTPMHASTWRAVFRNMADDVIIFVNKVKGPSDPMSMVAGIENPGAMSGQWSLFSDPLS
ncbi:hypothetical protein PRIPAC_89836 [Pristionchus pacificus]|nr:hypothetical protein PRIPAC_89836 [Pristionchus pacificus]|eukprot:PDM82820.1 hypothetical protein PRIPAC_37213 [Pristionchus pacificus]